MKKKNDNFLGPTFTKKTLLEIEDASEKGTDHLLFMNYMKTYNQSNILIPYLDISNNCIKELILISHPDDAMRIAEKHVKKMPNFLPLLHDGLISTTDVTHWKNQRSHYVDVFTPMSLMSVFDVSNNRAKYCSSLLYKLTNKCTKKINISNFFLNETMAQLQLAMFGVSDDFEKDTNKKLREAFGGKGKGYVRDFAKKIISGNASGPLKKSMDNRIKQTDTETYGNALLFSFAGHDTTGHTLTWLIYELSKNMTFQKKIQREVDQYWQKYKTPSLVSFKELPFMTKCIMETLRLWTAVPNGTFREIMEDDYINGKNGLTKIKKGTYVQILNYARHRNSDLWGEDVNEFNPERQFEPNEIWDGQYKFFNPATKRFSPFTFPPRDCIGKNFAQMEMRLILLYLLKDYTFILTEKQNKASLNYQGINKGTLYPPNIYDINNPDNKGFKPFNNGLYVYALSRKSKL